MSVLQWVVPEKIHIPPQTEEISSPSRKGERQNVLRCLGDEEANLCNG